MYGFAAISTDDDLCDDRCSNESTQMCQRGLPPHGHCLTLQGVDNHRLLHLVVMSLIVHKDAVCLLV